MDGFGPIPEPPAGPIVGEIQDQLIALKRADGMLYVPDVVDWAEEHQNTPLGRQFDWDDRSAARSWREQQARRIIAIYLVDGRGDRTHISLYSDRAHGGGYREITEVVAVPNLYQRALDDLLNELARLRGKYEHLVESKSVWDAYRDYERRVRDYRDDEERRARAAERRGRTAGPSESSSPPPARTRSGRPWRRRKGDGDEGSAPASAPRAPTPSRGGAGAARPGKKGKGKRSRGLAIPQASVGDD